MELFVDVVEIEDPSLLQVTEYEIPTSHVSVSKFARNGVRLNIRFERLWGIHVLNLFVPSMLMVAASMATLYIGNAHFEVNIQVRSS